MKVCEIVLEIAPKIVHEIVPEIVPEVNIREVAAVCIAKPSCTLG